MDHTCLFYWLNLRTIFDSRNNTIGGKKRNKFDESTYILVHIHGKEGDYNMKMNVWKMMGMYKLVCVGKLVTYWNLHPLQIPKYRKASTTISVVSVEETRVVG